VRWLKQIRIAWSFKVWPWQVPVEAVTYLAWPPPPLTAQEITRTRELAEKYGWERDDRP
jgi:hypothetical protein